jgi:hypothetical protein
MELMLHVAQAIRLHLQELIYYEVTNRSKTAVRDVIGFLFVALGSSTVQLHDSLGSTRACSCSEAG